MMLWLSSFPRYFKQKLKQKLEKKMSKFDNVPFFLHFSCNLYYKYLIFTL